MNATTSHSTLASSITKAASQQTYYTIRFLVDRERVPDAYRAYAYFRCVPAFDSRVSLLINFKKQVTAVRQAAVRFGEPFMDDVEGLIIVPLTVHQFLC